MRKYDKVGERLENVLELVQKVFALVLALAREAPELLFIFFIALLSFQLQSSRQDSEESPLVASFSLNITRICTVTCFTTLYYFLICFTTC